MRILIATGLFVWELLAAAPRGCVASLPLGSLQLSVQRALGVPLALREVNRVAAGDRLLYKPLELPPEFRKSARVSLVLVPADRSSKLAVFEPQPAAAPGQWTAPYPVTVAAVVFGPQGLDRKKVATLVNKDQELVSQLADYAEQTALVENLVDTLAAAEQGASPARSLDAALSGFAARSGAAMPKLDRSQPTDQQALVLLKALNPALGAYDPLAGRNSTRVQQSAGLAASVAALFFGSNIGLAAGGASMLLNLRTLLFPGTDFRSALAQPAGDSALKLCAKRQEAKSRTRLAYLWAHRIPNEGPPSAALAAPAHLPLGLKSALALRPGAAKQLERAREWALVSGGKSFPVAVRPQAGSLELDLAHSAAPPGPYQLTAKWDWDPFAVAGEVHLHVLPDLKGAALDPESQDRLLEGSGPVTVKLTGADFQFVQKVTLGEHALEFHLGPPLEAVVDTARLKAGHYALLLYSPDGSTQEVPIRVLPSNPKLASLPLRANLGESRQELLLRGTGLDRIEKIESPAAEVELGKGGRIFVQLGAEAKPGDRLSLRLSVEGLHAPVEVPGAIEVAGPRPRIESAEASLADDLGIALRPGELPAGSYATFSLRLGNSGAQPVLRLQCSGGERVLSLHPGEKLASAKLDSAGQDVVFLSLDPGAIGRPGCTLTAAAETEATGASDAFPLGRVIRLPRIASFTLTDEKLGASVYAGILTGQDLELIEKAGWDAATGLPVAGLPRPVAGEGQKQTLKLALPWPSPAPRAPLYIWLRGEREGRATSARY